MNKIQDELKLVFPTPEYKTQVEEYLQEFFDNGEYEIAGESIPKYWRNAQSSRYLRKSTKGFIRRKY